MAQDGWSLEQEEAPCTPPAAAPSLCSNNCGFFGSAATMNLCSSCYKSLVLLKSPASSASTPEPAEAEIEPRTPAFSPPIDPPSSASSSPCLTLRAEAGSGSARAGNVSFCDLKAPPLRCLACQKKVGLRGFKCRCGDLFCALHRYSDKHSCSFDYKAAGRASIEKANPVVKADKLHRI